MLTPARRRIFYIAAFVPTLLVLLVLEIVLQQQRHGIVQDLLEENPTFPANLMIHRKSDDENLVYELVPGAKALREGVEILINSDGFRDDEFPKPPPHERRRIVLVGDSVAWGYGVDMSMAFPQVLERELMSGNSAGPIIYNLAVDGYSTEQEVHLLTTRGLKYRPHLIIIHYVLNDPDTQDGGLSRYYDNTPRFELWHLASSAVANLRRQDESVPETLPRGEYHQGIHRLHRDQTEQQFRCLGELQQREKIPVLVVVSPVFQYKPGQPYPWHNIHQTIQTLCEHNGLHFLDLVDSFSQMGPRQVAYDVWHLNPRGHKITAEAICDYISQLEW